MRFSSGRYSQAICDRCGFAFPYQSIQTEPGTGWRVCRSCNDGFYSLTEHPQSRPRPIPIDAEALEHPRLDTDLTVSTSS